MTRPAEPPRSDAAPAASVEDKPVVSRPGVLAVLNASPESFSGNRVATFDGRIGSDDRAIDDAADLAASMVDSGADVLDIGAQSLRTDRPEISVVEEVDRLLPVFAAVRGRVPTTALSVDTYRHQVADAALAAGASIVNDPSGLRDRELADLVSGTSHSIVVAFNPGAPKVRRPRGERLVEPVEDCLRFVADRLEVLHRAGVRTDQLILDPGPDLYKAPDETVTVLRAGLTETGLFDRGGMRDTRVGQTLKQDPARVAAAACDALFAGRPEVVPAPLAARLSAALAGTLGPRTRARLRGATTKPRSSGLRELG